MNRVQILGSTRLARVAVPYLVEHRGVRSLALDPGAEDETRPWYAPVRALAHDEGVELGRAAPPADLVLDLDPDARPTRGEGPMLRLIAPSGARSPDPNRALLSGGIWAMALLDAAGTGTWARRDLVIPPDADAAELLDEATVRGLEALDAGWEAMLAGAPVTPLEHPLIAGRFRPQEAFLVWEQPAARVAARIRACAGPYGGARAHVGDAIVWLLDARVVAEEATGFDPGTIVAVDEGIEIATGRGVVRVERLRPGWRPARRAGAYAREVGLAAGYQLT